MENSVAWPIVPLIWNGVDNLCRRWVAGGTEDAGDGFGILRKDATAESTKKDDIWCVSFVAKDGGDELDAGMKCLAVFFFREAIVADAGTVWRCARQDISKPLLFSVEETNLWRENGAVLVKPAIGVFLIPCIVVCLTGKDIVEKRCMAEGFFLCAAAIEKTTAWIAVGSKIQEDDMGIFRLLEKSRNRIRLEHLDIRALYAWNNVVRDAIEKDAGFRAGSNLFGKAFFHVVGVIVSDLRAFHFVHGGASPSIVPIMGFS